MLPGVSGHLISESFLESQLIESGMAHTGDVNQAEAKRLRRRLTAWRRRSRWLGPASSVGAMLEIAVAPLVEMLGFGLPANIADPIGNVIGNIGAPPLGGCMRSGSQPIALVVVPWGERLDPFWRTAVTLAMRHAARWCFLFNGRHCRVIDAGRTYARRFIEFDLDLVVDDDRTFSAFWWVMHAGRFGSAGDAASTPLHTIVEASERHAFGVCRSLKEGVLAASTSVLAALVGRRISERASLNDSLEQALTIVYRLLFLLFAEARGLVPLWHPIYRESYSIEALRDAAEQPHGVAGLWDTMRAIARLAHAGCRAGDLRVTPFNGRLFAPSRTPLADRRDLDDRAAQRAVLALSTRAAADRTGRERIAYRDLGVEQLGAVYETLLDYEPRAQRGTNGHHRRLSVTLEPGSGVRKATGTFYTPQPIAEYLVRRALGPLVRGREAEHILSLRIVDPAMGSGAFLVAACRYLAAAYEAALIKGGRYHSGDFDEPGRAAIRRLIAERCLYGVDLNPMAVQLARLSLWLATLASDRPLTFLDHHLQAGDSLIGAWLTSLRHAPGGGARRAHRQGSGPPVLPFLDEAEARSALRDALPVRFNLESIPDDTLDQVRSKERALAALNRRDTALSKWKQIADLWCAAWFSAPNCTPPSSAFGELSETVLTGRGALPAATAEACLRNADEIARQRLFFHWELEFPEVFFDSSGGRLLAAGFDAVVGNPPWDMIRADAGSVDARVRSRQDVSAVLRFTRDAGIYVSQSDGHANRYQLFLERAISLLRPGGRLGLVLPSGLATDHGSARLRSRLLSACDVDALVGLDNQRKVFPIHRSVRFLLLSATAGSPTRSIACRLGETDPMKLETIGDEEIAAFPIRLTPAVLHRISGDDLTIPDLRTPMDLAIVERCAALFPPAGSDSGWAARFGRELNATDDRHLFRPPGAGIPVVEGKQLDPFRVDLQSARHAIADRDVRRLLRSARHEKPRLAYRDVASSTNRLTLIAAILPARCVSTHTVFCLRTPLPLQAQYFLCGVFNSFVANYLVRLRVTTHVTTATIERLPIPQQDDAPLAFREISALARRLSRRSDPLASARLQARVAGLYQLTAAEFEHVLGTFPLVERTERDAALREYIATEAQRVLR
jgi:hypothetical protein